MSLREREQALEAYQNYMKSEAEVLLAPTLGHGDSNSKIEDYRLFCTKEKGIYTILNYCQEGLALRVNVWYPECNEAQIMELLKSVNAESPEKAILMPDKGGSKSTPPTHIRVNDYTEGWQEVINTYGIPMYQEANPAIFAVVTFPFIFGMMYGDIGHGTLLFLAGLYLVMKAEDFRFTVPALFQARYMVLSLGIFAVYAGFMYNDLFSVGLQLFPSGFADVNGDGKWQPTYDVTNSGGPGPYPFGLDWAWENANNELLFVNSLKMKLSVLFGVLQMTVGVFLRWSNAFYEKNMVDFVFECVPMLVFMLCFFGWMDFMILYKWVHPIDNAPSIINSMICMAMGQQDDFPLWDGSVQLAQKLMLYTVCAVPIMLFFKPFILLFQHNQKQKKKTGLEQGLLEVEAPPAQSHGHGHDEEEFEFGEVFIHQIIETIEYVLGTVSHTASYLRIWALSLAHQQLSQVFFQKTLMMGLVMPFPSNVIVLYVMFTAWFGVTLGVLLGMDVLECFLHTLRLHWVEFQSKFYKANGEKFEPFSIKKLVTPTGDE
jgi:V-type H+-transporting ATPase subunit a